TSPNTTFLLQLLLILAGRSRTSWTRSMGESGKKRTFQPELYAECEFEISRSQTLEVCSLPSRIARNTCMCACMCVRLLARPICANEPGFPVSRANRCTCDELSVRKVHQLAKL